MPNPADLVEVFVNSTFGGLVIKRNQDSVDLVSNFGGLGLIHLKEGT